MRQALGRAPSSAVPTKYCKQQQKLAAAERERIRIHFTAHSLATPREPLTASSDRGILVSDKIKLRIYFVRSERLKMDRTIMTCPKSMVPIGQTKRFGILFVSTRTPNDEFGILISGSGTILNRLPNWERPSMKL